MKLLRLIRETRKMEGNQNAWKGLGVIEWVIGMIFVMVLLMIIN